MQYIRKGEEWIPFPLVGEAAPGHWAVVWAWLEDQEAEPCIEMNVLIYQNIPFASSIKFNTLNPGGGGRLTDQNLTF